MKKKIYLPVLLLIFFASCLQPDPLEIEKQEIEIRQNNKALSVIDIDPHTVPGIDDRFYVHDIVSGARLDAAASSNTNTVVVQPSGMGFLITGAKAGGMGIVKFTAGDKSVELRVFVRNWNKDEVYRHTLYANTDEYPYDPNVEHNPDDPRAPNKLAAYQLIVDSGFHYEAPDGLSSRVDRNNTKVHQEAPRETESRRLHNGPHILQIAAINEPFLRTDIFSFTLHFADDGDMVGGYDDRQRLELKTMDTGRAFDAKNDEPDNFMYSTGGGDTFTYRWKFRLPEDFRVSSEYTHIHQIKPEGGDSGNPTFTLTGRKLRSGREVLQLIYRGPIRDNGDPSVNWYPCEVDLEPFKGEWIRAEETVTYDNPGTYRIRLVRIRDMRVLMEYIYSPEQYEELDPFAMFRNGNSYIRPKFGVYRRVMHMTPFGLPNPDDPVRDYLAENNCVSVLFADFEMDKLKR